MLMVEAAIAALGIDPAAARVPSAAAPQWALRRGSARIFVGVHDDGGDGLLRLIAPVVKLPDEASRPALFAHLLELNARELAGVAFGITGADVVLVSQRSLRDLDRSEVDAALAAIGRAADHHDDALSKRFGTVRSTDAG